MIFSIHACVPIMSLFCSWASLREFSGDSNFHSKFVYEFWPFLFSALLSLCTWECTWLHRQVSMYTFWSFFFSAPLSLCLFLSDTHWLLYESVSPSIYLSLCVCGCTGKESILTSAKIWSGSLLASISANTWYPRDFCTKSLLPAGNVQVIMKLEALSISLYQLLCQDSKTGAQHKRWEHGDEE